MIVHFNKKGQSVTDCPFCNNNLYLQLFNIYLFITCFFALHDNVLNNTKNFTELSIGRYNNNQVVCYGCKICQMVITVFIHLVAGNGVGEPGLFGGRLFGFIGLNFTMFLKPSKQCDIAGTDSICYHWLYDTGGETLLFSLSLNYESTPKSP